MNRLQTERLRRVQAQHITEAELQRCVVELARRLGFTVHHAHDARHGEAGAPDLEIVGKGRFLKVELKSQTGTLTNTRVMYRHRGKLHARPRVGSRLVMVGGQTEYLENLLQAGVACFLWKPANWLDGTIERVLKDGHQEEDLWRP